MTPAHVFRAHLLTPTARGWAHWRDGRLDVHEGRIASVGPWKPARRYTDLRPHIVFPGLVDTHAHVPQLAARGSHADDLLSWLAKWIYPMEREFRGARARTLSRRFMTELTASGTTTAALYTSAWPDSVEACFDAAERVGIHAWIGMPLMDVGAYRPVTTKQVLEEVRELARLDRPRLRFAVTPRFALSCTRELLEGAGHLAREKKLPVQTHLAEQLDECRRVRRRFGCSYIQVYERAGLVGPRSLFAHAVWLKREEWGRFAVAHCPTSNLFLRSGVMDWQASRVARVGLGSDVGAGPQLCLFDVMRAAWMVHRAVTPSDLLRAATVDGARALGFDDVGSLEPGKSADWLVLDGTLAAESTGDLLSRILHCADRASILQVYVGGTKLSHAMKRL